jgi:hypothetical protein
VRTLLQKLIQDRLVCSDRPESLRSIARHSGVEFTSLRKYYQEGAIPKDNPGGNREKLAKYFGVEPAALIQPPAPSPDPNASELSTREQLSVAVEKLPEQQVKILLDLALQFPKVQK